MRKIQRGNEVFIMENSASCNCNFTAETLAMGSFPMQEWCEPYELGTALYSGTIFPCLNMNFYAAEDIPCPFCGKAADAKLSEQEKALDDICMVGFAINDLTLYLDTHPDCPNGTKLLKELLQKRLDGLADYAKKYNPLTQLSIVTGTPDTDKYTWDEGPLPWEGGNL